MNFIDPSGEFAIAEIFVVDAITAVAAIALYPAIKHAVDNAHTITLPDDWDNIGPPRRKPRPKGRPKPRNCPTGTKPIDEVGLPGDLLHDIKDEIGTAPDDWVGIDEDGNIIIGDADGNVDEGSGNVSEYD